MRDGLRVSARVGRADHELVRSRDGAAWGLHLEPAPPAGPIAARVADAARRFLPTVTAVGAGVTAVELFSAPARAVPAGYAEVRATVLDRATRKPLPGLRLTVTAGGASFVGHADGRGDVLLCLPWPKTAAAVDGTPPLHDRTWPMTVAAATPKAALEGEDFVLDLDATYTNRTLAAKATGTAVLGEQVLAYGAPLVLKTEGADALLVR